MSRVRPFRRLGPASVYSFPETKKRTDKGFAKPQDVKGVEEKMRFPEHVIAASRDMRADDCCDYGAFIVMPESKYSCLMPWHIPVYREFFGKHFTALSDTSKAPKVIIDATAHIGCDAMNFANMFQNTNITAIESDEKAFKCLKTNIAAFVHAVKSIRSVHADCVKFLTDNVRSADLVYVDPPWGGPDYRSKGSIMLELSGKPIYDIISLWFERGVTSTVVLKAPPTFDMNSFVARLKTGKIVARQAVHKTTSTPASIEKGKTKNVAFELILIERQLLLESGEKVETKESEKETDVVQE